MVVTFVQAGLAAWAVYGFQANKLAIGAFVGAGLSAVWNVILKPFAKSQGWMK